MRRFKHVKSIPTALYCQAECIPIALCLAELVAPLHPRRPYGKHAVRHVWGQSYAHQSNGLAGFCRSKCRSADQVLARRHQWLAS